MKKKLLNVHDLVCPTNAGHTHKSLGKRVDHQYSDKDFILAACTVSWLKLAQIKLVEQKEKAINSRNWCRR